MWVCCVHCITCLYLYVYVFRDMCACMCMCVWVCVCMQGCLCFDYLLEFLRVCIGSLSVCIFVHVYRYDYVFTLCWISSCLHSISENAMFQSTNQSGLSFSGLIDSVHIGWYVVIYDTLVGLVSS